MPEDFTRDATADMAVCEAATPGPWRNCPHGGSPIPIGPDKPIFCLERCGEAGTLFSETYHSIECSREDGDFVCLARTALPYWIRRAMAAEMELLGAKKALAKITRLESENKNVTE